MTGAGGEWSIGDGYDTYGTQAHGIPASHSIRVSSTDLGRRYALAILFMIDYIPFDARAIFHRWDNGVRFYGRR